MTMRRKTAVAIALWASLAGIPLAFSAVSEVLDADYETLENPMSPLGQPRPTATINAQMGYYWLLGDNQTYVMVLMGNFQLTLPDRQLSSNDAVVWFSLDNESQRIKKIEVFMEGNARITEPSRCTEDQVLFATVYTASRVEMIGQSFIERDGSDQSIYLRALKCKSRFATPATAPSEQIIVHPAAEMQVKAPRQITIKGNFVIGPKVNGQPVLIGTGGVYVIQSGEGDNDATELRATNAVLFLRPEATDLSTYAAKEKKPSGNAMAAAMAASTSPADGAKGESPSPEMIQKELSKLPTEEQAAREVPVQEQARANQFVVAAYLEGDVVLSRGYRQIRAANVFYDFENSTASMSDVVAYTDIPARNVPIYIRAAEAQQLSETQFVAYDAKVSTSEFYTPSYHVGATRVYFEDRTERLPNGEQVGLAAGTYRAYNPTMNVGGMPILWWPYTKGDFKQSETSLRSMTASYSSDFGATGKLKWDTFSLLGMDKPEGTDSVLRTDYYGDRGPGTGVDVDYERENYFGLMRGYWIQDHGEDDLGGYRGTVEPPYDNRGRALVRHRHFLPEGWELTLEASYLSDQNYLEEFENSEFNTGKEQETVLYLKKIIGDDMAFSTLAKWRLNDFQTQTEQLPEAVFDVLGKTMFNGHLTWYSENRVAASRYRVDHGIPTWMYGWSRYANTDIVVRGDSRQELEAPIKLGPVNVVGFGTVRGSAWDDTPFAGSEDRLYGSGGIKASTYQWKVFDDVESRLLDVHRIKHIMKEDVTVWGAHNSLDPWKLTPFERGVEDLTGAEGIVAGWRNRWQTKRGGPGNWRTVDWLTLDIEAGAFGDSEEIDLRNRTRGRGITYRPENSVTSDFIALRSSYRISDTTALLYDLIYDVDSGNIGSSGLGLHVDRDPRTSYFIAHRYIGESNSNLIAGGFTYRLTPKYTLAFREEYDIVENRNANTSITIIRKLPRWYVAVSAEFDETQNVDSFSVSVWPEGVPEWTIGSRRFSSLENSTAIRP
jgi:hypothetical protein